MHYYENTGRVCEHTGEPISYQVVEAQVFGGETIENRTGPSCWIPDCPGDHQ